MRGNVTMEFLSIGDVRVEAYGRNLTLQRVQMLTCEILWAGGCANASGSSQGMVAGAVRTRTRGAT